MATSKDYRKGLEKLRLYDPATTCLNDGTHHRLMSPLEHIDGHHVEPTDIREDPAFAWHVLKVLHSSDFDRIAIEFFEGCAHYQEDGDLAAALYAAVEQIGKESTDG
jgi:hypothetical protein